MSEEIEYASLYEYLGKAAGSELGKEVYKEAQTQGVPVKTQEVETKKYKGRIMTYPKRFLEFYFREPDSNKMVK